MARVVTALTGIYQAEGSLRGELAYVVGRMLGTAHCALCDITHASVREKAGFRACREALPVPLKNVHLDERSPPMRAFSEGKTPCVVAHTADGLRLVLDCAALERCAGSVTRFREELSAAMRAQGLVFEGTSPG
jgi:hypothetical protein